jgi:hypothetical protein
MKIRVLILPFLIVFLTGCVGGAMDSMNFRGGDSNNTKSTKAYREAMAFCEGRVDAATDRYNANFMSNSRADIERMRRDRILNARMNPTYDTTLDCNVWGGNYINCSGVSTPDYQTTSNLYSGYTAPEMSAQAGASLATVLGSFFTRPGEIDDCMANLGYNTTTKSAYKVIEPTAKNTSNNMPDAFAKGQADAFAKGQADAYAKGYSDAMNDCSYYGSKSKPTLKKKIDSNKIYNEGAVGFAQAQSDAYALGYSDATCK